MAPHKQGRSDCKVQHGPVLPAGLEDGICVNPDVTDLEIQKKDSDLASVEPPKETSKLLLLLLCMVCALEGADTMLLRAVLFALKRDLRLELGDVAVMTLCQALCQALAAPVWGVLADRRVLRRKTILIVGATLQGCVTACVAGANSLLPMIILRSLTGAMLASLRPISNGIVADVTSEGSRGKVYGWMQLAMHVGMIAGSFCAPLSLRKVGDMEGWRIAFLAVGALAGTVAVCIAFGMVEPEREPSKCVQGKPATGGALSQELKRIVGYLKTPTFCTLVVQGCFGCVPWNALGYQILFYQVSGLKDLASVLQVVNLVAGAMGALMGGMIGDCCARRSRYHGRPCVGMISILAGIPGVWLLFMVQPPENAKFAYYMIVVIFLGLTTTWCPTGVNWPLLSEVVDPNGRSAVLAWQTALEGAFAAVCGNAAVGFLADKVFGYDLHRDVGDGGSVENQRALGKALMSTTCLPWVLCFLIAGILHWGYPRDLRRLQREREAQRQADRAEQEQRRQEEEASVGCRQEPADFAVEDESPSKARDKAAAAAAAGLPRVMASAAGSNSPARLRPDAEKCVAGPSSS